MDVIERLRNLLRASAWVRDPALALRLIPELAVDLPPVVEIVTTGGASERGVPTRAVDALALPVARVVLPLAEAAIDGKPREDLQKLGMERLLSDPLLPEVASLLAQAASPRLRAVAVPALAVAWTSARLLGPGWPELKELDGSLAARATGVSRRLGDLQPAQRARALLDVAWGLRARLAAAASLVGSAGFAAATGGLYRRVMADPLLFLFARGTLDVELPVPLVASILGVPIEEEMASSLEKAAAVALTGLAERRQKSKTTPVDEALLGGLPVELALAPASARSVLLDPWAGPLLIAALPELADPKALAKLGVGKNAIAAFGRRDATRALAASWRDLTQALLVWDILSALVHRLVPVRQDGARHLVAGGALPAQARWDLLVPRRMRPTVVATVVAVRLTRVRAQSAKVAEDRSSPLLVGAAEGAWGRLVAAAPEGVFETTADHGVGVFCSPIQALSFALRAQRELSGPLKLPVGLLGDPVDLPRGLSSPVGVATGEVLGGTDGEAAAFDGPAVAEALALSGGGPPAAELGGDPANIRSAAFTADGLRSSGVVANAATVAAVIGAARTKNLPIHVRERGGRAGGVEDDFAAYPMLAWYESPEDRLVVSLLAVGAVAGPVEVIGRDASAFAALAKDDRESASGGFGGFAGFDAAPPTAQRVSSFGSFAADPFGGAAAPERAQQRPPGDAPTDVRVIPPASVPPAAAPRPPAPQAARGSFGTQPVAAPSSPFDDDPFADMDTAPDGRTGGRVERPAEASADTWALTNDEADLFALPSGEERAPVRPAALEDPFAAMAQDGPAVSIEEEDDGWGPETPLPGGLVPPQDDWMSLSADGSPAPAPPAEARAVARTENILELDTARGGFGFRQGGGSSDVRPDAVANELARATGGAILDAAAPSGFSLRDDELTDPAEPQGFSLADDLEPVTDASGLLGRGRAAELDALDFPGLDDFSGAARSAPDESLEDAVPDWDSAGLFSDAGPGFTFVEEDEQPPEPVLAAPSPAPLDESAADGETYPPMADDRATGAFAMADEDDDEAGDEQVYDPGSEGGFSYIPIEAAAGAAEGFPEFETGGFEIEESEEADAMHRSFDRPNVSHDPAPDRPVAAPSPPPPKASPPQPKASPPPSKASPPQGLPDLGYMFQGYVVHQSGAEFVFGRRYGKLLVDSHTYRATDKAAAYASFLQDKAREGFVPRAELTRPAPPEGECAPLEQRLLVDAYRAMVGA